MLDLLPWSDYCFGTSTNCSSVSVLVKTTSRHFFFLIYCPIIIQLVRVLFFLLISISQFHAQIEPLLGKVNYKGEGEVSNGCKFTVWLRDTRVLSMQQLNNPLNVRLAVETMMWKNHTTFHISSKSIKCVWWLHWCIFMFRKRKAEEKMQLELKKGRELVLFSYMASVFLQDSTFFLATWRRLSVAGIQYTSQPIFMFIHFNWVTQSNRLISQLESPTLELFAQPLLIKL